MLDLASEFSKKFSWGNTPRPSQRELLAGRGAQAPGVRTPTMVPSTFQPWLRPMFVRIRIYRKYLKESTLLQGTTFFHNLSLVWGLHSPSALAVALVALVGLSPKLLRSIGAPPTHKFDWVCRNTIGPTPLSHVSDITGM